MAHQACAYDSNLKSHRLESSHGHKSSSPSSLTRFISDVFMSALGIRSRKKNGLRPSPNTTWNCPLKTCRASSRTSYHRPVIEACLAAGFSGAAAESAFRATAENTMLEKTTRIFVAAAVPFGLATAVVAAQIRSPLPSHKVRCQERWMRMECGLSRAFPMPNRRSAISAGLLRLPLHHGRVYAMRASSATTAFSRPYPADSITQMMCRSRAKIVFF